MKKNLLQDLRQFCVSYNIDGAYDNIWTRRTSVHNIIIIYTQYILYVYIMYIYIIHLRALTPADEVRSEYNIIYVSRRVCVFVYRFE